MPYPEQQLRICNRTGDVIEPMIKKQWFMDCTYMNDVALSALQNDTVSLFVFCLISPQKRCISLI